MTFQMWKTWFKSTNTALNFDSDFHQLGINLRFFFNKVGFVAFLKGSNHYQSCRKCWITKIIYFRQDICLWTNKCHCL